MKDIGLHEIRRKYLDFFKSKEHLILPSFSLVPKDDESLLLIGAGMAPLKKYFTGEETPENTRVSTCQKCIRTGDIENVGITARHATFFEMLGNFSFGDYFKKESIQWAWEFMTEVLELDEEKLWVTVYLDDDEAEEIWNKDIGLPLEKIIRLGKEDNFWELEVGPSGPSSEIFYDRGPKVGCGLDTCQPGCDCDRFIEVWNLVFTQFDKDESGIYHDLPNPNIDTGMGLERMAAVMQDVDNIFEVREIKEILEVVEKVSNKEYGKNSENDISMRIITDHARAMTFLVSDGVRPENEGRGYVLRRLIRRASRHGKLLGINKIFLGEIIEKVIDSWSIEYKELKENREEILKVIELEEKRFEETIDQGLDILENYIEEMKSENSKVLSGEKAFRLYDTYGFPLDLTKEILEEKNLKVDIDSFNKHMEGQRERARAARNNGDSGWIKDGNISIYGELDTDFIGYEERKSLSKILGVFTEEEELESLEEGDTGILILDKTPFYPEGGGQVGDTGLIYNDEVEVEVLDTQVTSKEHILHIVKVLKGNINSNIKVKTRVDGNRRDYIKKNHTATHLLHQALKDVLGEHVNQAGSVVEDDRLRFDFTHEKPVTQEEILEIENIVNDKIFKSLVVRTEIMPLEEAKSQGVIGLFDEKYDENVRVLSIGDYSRELCGGIHVKNTSEIGIFKIVSESSVASGVRRIEAVTSKEVYRYLYRMESDFEKISEIVGANRNNLLDRLKSLTEENQQQKEELESLKSKIASSSIDDILKSSRKIGDINLITYKIENMDMGGLRNIADEIKNKTERTLIVLAGIERGKLYFVVAATKDILKDGVHSGNIIREVASVTGGSGGGRPDMAQAGGKDLTKIEDSFDKAEELLKDIVNN